MPDAQFETELRKAVGATVGDVMTREPPVCKEDDTLERVAELYERYFGAPTAEKLSEVASPPGPASGRGRPPHKVGR